MKVARFMPDEEGRNRYEYCLMSLLLSRREIPLTEWDDVISVTKKLKAIGRDTGEKLMGAAIYQLVEGGAVQFFERSEVASLRSFLTQGVWRPMVLGEVRATIEWLDKLPDAQPEAV